MAKKRMPHKVWRSGNPKPSLPSDGIGAGRMGKGLGGFARPVCWLAVALVGLTAPSGQAYVALMAGQKAKPLNGSFNTVPVLHSNQPEEVEGPGILINTAPGVSYAAETGAPLPNSNYTFSGEFGIHLHHKYIPNKDKLWNGRRRSELTLGLILINTGYQPVRIQFDAGAVRNSFQAPYLADNLMGVKPLGLRGWNTGPGDATATQLLRGKLDPNLSGEITIPSRSRVVLFRTELPSLGIANALLRGRSDGPFHMAVVAAKKAQNDYDIVDVLDQSKLAPGRVYLSRVSEINNRQLFSRVGGVAIGDTYQATINHDLIGEGSLHVPFTSTNRHNFGTNEIQVNPLASRMVDSSLDNVGTYGVRYEVSLNLVGAGPYDLIISHPSGRAGSKPFTAFRGSIQITTESGLEEVHVGMRSGESLGLTSLNLKPGVINPIKVTMVYPADATPGHLLSVVSSSQITQGKNWDRREKVENATITTTPINIPIKPIIPSQSISTSCANDLGTLYLQGACLEAPPLPVNGNKGASRNNESNVSQAVAEKYQQALTGANPASSAQQSR